MLLLVGLIFVLPARADGIDVRIVSDKDQYVWGEPVQISVVLRNDSGAGIRFPHLFLLDPEYMNFMFYEVVGPDGVMRRLKLVRVTQYSVWNSEYIGVPLADGDGVHLYLYPNLSGFGSSESGGQGQSVAAAGGATDGPRFSVNDETTVLDDELRPAAVGVVGKLARRGRVPLGYYKDPEKSAATFPVVDGVRWSVPGDHARIEADGTITVLGRGSGSINTGGEKVYPEEVEAALKSHPDVFDVVVVGAPDERWGERVVAVVEPRQGAIVALPALVEHVRGHLAPYKVPRAVVVVDTVVRSPSGKPDYRWARARAEAEAVTPSASAPR
jgi:hypothetical protein